MLQGHIQFPGELGVANTFGSQFVQDPFIYTVADKWTLDGPILMDNLIPWTSTTFPPPNPGCPWID